MTPLTGGEPRRLMSQQSVEQLRERLIQSFDDYHSSIRKQTQWLDELIEAVRREEREGGGNGPDDKALRVRP